MSIKRNPQNLAGIGRHRQPADNLKYPRDLGAEDSKPYILFDIRDATTNRHESLGLIAMYMPATLNVSYGANYENMSLPLWGFAENVVAGVDKFMSGDYKGAGEVVGAIVSKGGQYAEAITHSMMPTQAGAIYELYNGKVINPHMAVLFKGINFRSFQISFQMMARNEAETHNIRDIIQKFKYHMHPEFLDGTADTAVWMKYPENFKISLYSPGDKFLFKLGDCVLKDLTVDYTSSGGAPVFFENGAPVDIRMTLTFQETHLVTKEKVGKQAGEGGF